MITNPTDVKTLSTTPTLTSTHLKARIAKQSGKRYSEVTALSDEFFRLGTKVGLNADVLSGMFDLETDSARSPAWESRLNPGGIGITDQFDNLIGFPTGLEAARAMIVHYMAYARGHDNRLAPYIKLDPRFSLVHGAGFAGIAQVLTDLGNGRWATDPIYAQKVASRIDAIRASFATPAPTPAPDGSYTIPAGIIYKESANWHDRNPGAKIRRVVHHITDSAIPGTRTLASIQSPLSWFMAVGSGASSHFLIDRDGTIYQVVSTSRAAWTNGKVDNPRQDIPSLLADLKQTYWFLGSGRGINMNDFCVTIEYHGLPEIGVTRAQVESGIKVTDYVCDRYGVSRNRDGQNRHGDIDSRDRAYCPGGNFPLADVITGIGGDPNRTS